MKHYRYLFISFLFLFGSNNYLSAQSSNKLLRINQLDSLTQWKIQKGPNGKWFAFTNGKNTIEENEFHQIESAVFITNSTERIDTLDITQEMFPNLKVVKFREVFYNQLVGISKIKSLQWIDLTSMPFIDYQIDTYGLLFPQEFWELKNLQVLEITGSNLSDISENISQLPNLKVLRMARAYKFQYNYFLPWSILLKDGLVFIPSYDPEIHQEGTLFSAAFDFGRFENESEFVNDIKELPHRFQKGWYMKNNDRFIVDDTMVLINDSLELRIPLDTKSNKIEGTATLTKRNTILQIREYQNSQAHGKWILDLDFVYCRSKFDHGAPSGHWKMTNSRPHFIHRKHLWFNNNSNTVRGSGRAVRLFRRKYYSNYNDLWFFDQCLDAIENN